MMTQHQTQDIQPWLRYADVSQGWTQAYTFWWAAEQRLVSAAALSLNRIMQRTELFVY